VEPTADRLQEDTMNYPALTGRTAVVTGASSGMRAATAALLAASGARVATVARRADRLKEPAGGLIHPFPTDVTDAAAVAATAAEIRRTLGRVDLVVNSAGVMLPGNLDEADPADWRRMIDLNLAGLLWVTRAFAADLTAAAAGSGAADLVNISSIGAHVAFPAYAVYGATKAAVSHLSASLRTELGPLGVRVTNIEPGLTDTELGSHVGPDALRAELAAMFSTLGALRADDIADLVGYAVSRLPNVNLRQLVVLPTDQA
jgi:NADP-dependent 3-hydroxy acid dehydrogenase YdfG